MNEIVDESITEKDECHLTPTREKILEAMLNPEFLGLSITEKCQRISVSRQAWYSALRDKEFMSLVKKNSMDLIKERLGEIISASIKVATNSGARGYADRRLLLEMAGLYVPKQELSGEFIAGAIALDPEERRRRIIELERKA